MTLAELDFFEHDRSCTLWLRPDAQGGCPAARLPLMVPAVCRKLCAWRLHSWRTQPLLLSSPHAAELLEVQAALARAFPQCGDLSTNAGRRIQRFTPHLSLGQWRTRGDVVAAMQRHAASWQPVTFQAAGVALISRHGFDDPFSVQWWVPFGGGEPVFLGAPYCATAGDCCLPAASSGGGAAATAGAGGVAAIAQQLVGIGAARPDGSVWNFAYGMPMASRWKPA